MTSVSRITITTYSVISVSFLFNFNPTSLIVLLSSLPPLLNLLILLQLPLLPHLPPDLLNLLHSCPHPGISNMELPHQMIINSLLSVTNNQESSTCFTNLHGLGRTKLSINPQGSFQSNLLFQIISLLLQLIT